MKILVTGGAGYIGSVLVNKLIEQGHKVNVIDDLSNGFRENIDKRAIFTEGSILDKDNLNKALEGVEMVYHLAAKIRVDKKINKFIFASTAAVYGNPDEFPVNENSKTNPVNVYGATKLEIDNYLEANAKNMGISTICFRFFNIGGALKTKEGSWLKIKHEGATHLIPSILHSSSKKPLTIFGNDWPTKDGTPTRDFVHVVDLADALIKALNTLEKSGNQIINLGTATGSTVLEVVKTAEKSLNKVISFNFAGRRAGDSFALVTSNQKAQEVLNWQPIKTLSDILIDAQDELLANN